MENIKNSYKNSKFKISVSTWNKECELLDGSYSVSDIQDYFECKKTINPSTRIYLKKVKKGLGSI